MAFASSLEITAGVATITLSGELDAASAPVFRADVERAAAKNVRRLVLIMHDLSYMASAGLRALVFAKQKMGAAVDVYVVGAQPGVSETLQLTGFDNSVISVAAYDPATIESN
jgi:anti-anti-sigma factor